MEWVQALADCTGLPVECTAVPEGAALGSAFLARCASIGSRDGGLPGARRSWAPTGPDRRAESGRVEPVAPIPAVPGALGRKV